MRNLLRTPLTWLVIAEFIVVGVLIVLAWHAVQGAVRPVLASPVLQAPDTSTPSDSALPDLQPIGKAAPGPLPGLNLDSAFWRERLAQLNQDQVFFEQLEWTIVHSAVDAMQRYVQAVVVPAIQRAERGG
ncbi:MAG TPA: hypothetical protein VEU76_10180 [Candidatus Udaeobacter sp.]|nr:hypothetical protein [Candidatus Udaeobacter sp.]